MKMNKIIFFALLISGLANAAPFAQVEIYSNASTQVSIEGAHPRTIDSKGELLQGDSVVTGPGQTAKITFSDLSEVWVNPESKLTLEKYSDIPKNRLNNMFLEKGLARALVTKLKDDKIQFQLKTRAATMGVRGTDFVAETEPSGKTSLYTLDGAVAFGRTPQDLLSDRSSRVIRRNKQSDMAPGQVLPSVGTKFDPKKLINRLQVSSPHMAKSIAQDQEKRKTVRKQEALAHSKDWTPPPPTRKAKRKK
jgi:hypothetical protein